MQTFGGNSSDEESAERRKANIENEQISSSEDETEKEAIELITKQQGEITKLKEELKAKQNDQIALEQMQTNQVETYKSQIDNLKK